MSIVLKVNKAGKQVGRLEDHHALLAVRHIPLSRVALLILSHDTQLGMGYALRDCRGVTGVNAVSARATVTIVHRQLPLFVTEFEAYVQVSLVLRILALQDYLGRHFSSPLQRSLKSFF